METYRVYFHQINQSRYEVEAKNMNEAIAKATKKWKKENGPNVMSVELQED